MTRFVRREQRPLCRTKCIDRLKSHKSERLGFKVRFQEVYRALCDGDLSKIFRLTPRLDSLFLPGGMLPKKLIQRLVQRCIPSEDLSIFSDKLSSGVVRGRSTQPKSTSESDSDSYSRIDRELLCHHS